MEEFLTLQISENMGKMFREKFAVPQKRNMILINHFSMQKLFSASMYGIHGNLVEVEVDVVTGM